MSDDECDMIAFRAGAVCSGQLHRAIVRAAHAAGMRAGIERAAAACKQRGDELVAKWDAHGDAEMAVDAKARAWECLQCAATIRALEGKT